MKRLLFLLILVAFPAWGQVQPIDDPNHLLTDAQRAALSDKLMANYNATKVHIVVWLPALAKDDALVDKAVEYFKTHGIGQKGVDNGVLLLIDWKNHRSRIEVGYGLEGVMTDAATKQLQDTVMSPLFKKGDLAGGIMAGVDQLAAWSTAWVKGETTPTPTKSGPPFWIILVVLLGAGTIASVLVAAVVNARLREEEKRQQEERDHIARQRAAAETRSQRATEAAQVDEPYLHQQAAALAAMGIGTATAAAASYRRPRSAPPAAKASSSSAVRKSRSNCSSYSSCSSRSSPSDSSSSSSSSSSSYDSGGGSSGGGGSDGSW